MIRDRYPETLLPRIALGVLLLLPLPAVADPLWKMSLDLDPATGTLQGELRLPLTAGSHSFTLLDDLDLRAVEAAGRPLDAISVEPGQYRLDVPAAAAGEIRLSWGGRLPDADPQRSRLFLTPEGGFLPEGPGWYPRFEQEAFALRLEGRTPPGQRFVATGSLSASPRNDDRGYAAVYEHPGTDAITVATGPWEERERLVDGVRVRTLFPAQLDRAHAENYLDHSANYLPLFVDRAGPYPYQSFTVAASPMPVGFAFAGFTLLGERVIPLPFIPRTSLAHELMHNWWGTGVRIDYESGNWSEGLTTYMADYHLDEQRGDAADTRRRWLLDLAWLPEELDRPLVTFQGGNQGANRIVGYNRGAMLFRMLEERIGSEAFASGARLLNERHVFGVASWNDVVRAFSDAADEELHAFFEPWLERPRLPELALHSVAASEEQGRWWVNGSLEQAQDEPPWPLRVPLEIETESGVERHVVTLDDRRTDFRVALQERPVALSADPHHEVLRRLPDPPPVLRTVSLDPDTRLIAMQDGLEPFARAVLGFAPERAEDFDPDTPLLVMGSTSDVIRWLDRAGAPRPPDDLAQSGHARMWTLPGTRTAVVSTDDAAGLNNIARTLRHHGHRSYLVQDADGRTEEVGVWESESDPLRVELVSASVPASKR
ncbi:M1 family metallopeptidase [Thioalkalivibrio sp.]|uniref:M1 family metallopeptidase n=1 Tax=Thioalkalivibrio sp. TaxID=2093813 RepID=UPI003566D3ED